MEEIWKFSISYWPYIASVLGAALGIASFLKNVLTINKLYLEVKKLKSEAESKKEEEYKIIQKATEEEIKKYGKRYPRKYRRLYCWSGKRYSIFRKYPPSVVTEPGRITQPIKRASLYLIFYYVLELYQGNSWVFDSLAIISHFVFSYCLIAIILDQLVIEKRLWELRGIFNG